MSLCSGDRTIGRWSLKPTSGVCARAGRCPSAHSLASSLVALATARLQSSVAGRARQASSWSAASGRGASLGRRRRSSLVCQGNRLAVCARPRAALRAANPFPIDGGGGGGRAIWPRFVWPTERLWGGARRRDNCARRPGNACSCDDLNDCTARVGRSGTAQGPNGACLFTCAELAANEPLSPAAGALSWLAKRGKPAAAWPPARCRVAKNELGRGRLQAGGERALSQGDFGSRAASCQPLATSGSFGLLLPFGCKKEKLRYRLGQVGELASQPAS